MIKSKSIAVLLILILLITVSIPLVGCDDTTPIIGIFDGKAVVMGPKNKNAKKIVIPETYEGIPVTIINSEAFELCALEEIIIPKTVKEIKDRAFARSRIKEIYLPGVEIIGDEAFRSCPALKRIVWSSNLKEVGVNAFPLGFNRYPE